MLQKYLNILLVAKGTKKIRMNSDLFEESVCEQDRKFECQNRKVLLIVGNCPAHPDDGDLKAIDLCFLPPKTISKTMPMDQNIIRSLDVECRWRMIQKIIKIIDYHKPVPKASILDAMKMLTIC